MTLVHFAETPYAQMFAWPSVRQEPTPSFKPRGLWLSDEDDFGWRAWCEAEAFRLEALRFATRFTLRPNHQVRILRSRGDILRFTDDYGAPPPWPIESWTLRQGFYIDWALVAQDYQGLLITPYQWSMRLDQRCFWYYAWDCASGCVWDLSAVQRWCG